MNTRREDIKTLKVGLGVILSCLNSSFLIGPRYWSEISKLQNFRYNIGFNISSKGPSSSCSYMRYIFHH
jgi:hypothetical protein